MSFFTQFWYKTTIFLLKIYLKSAWYADLPAHSADFDFLTVLYLSSILKLYIIYKKLHYTQHFVKNNFFYHFLSFFDTNLPIFYQKTPKKLRGTQFLLRSTQLFKIRQVNIKIIYSIYKRTNQTRF